MRGHRGHTEGELDQEWSTEVKVGKRAIRCGHGKAWWPRQLGHLFDTCVGLQGQRRGKGGIQTGVDPGVNGADESGEERDRGEGQDGGVPAVTKGFSLQ